jgi:hypothetical protein
MRRRRHGEPSRANVQRAGQPGFAVTVGVLACFAFDRPATSSDTGIPTACLSSDTGIPAACSSSAVAVCLVAGFILTDDLVVIRSEVLDVVGGERLRARRFAVLLVRILTAWVRVFGNAFPKFTVVQFALEPPEASSPNSSTRSCGLAEVVTSLIDPAREVPCPVDQDFPTRHSSR